jgi:hypothetical protein
MMKKIYLTLLALFTLGYSFSQMEDGEYTYSNTEITLMFTIGGAGWEIYDIVLVKNATDDSMGGTGEWFKVNMNGVDKDYEGPEGWYQFQTDDCRYDFNEAKNELNLNQFDCFGNPDDAAEYILIRNK